MQMASHTYEVKRAARATWQREEKASSQTIYADDVVERGRSIVSNIYQGVIYTDAGRQGTNRAG